MGNISANIKMIGELEFSKLNIPPYQRPYRWKTSHVETLLNSIQNNIEKGEYRIGSIILHPNEERKLDIVDGQQRLTTLSLLFLYLEGEESIHCLACKYNHLESKQNLYNNYTIITNWADKQNKERLLNFILNKCSMVVIEVEELSEAFQMFDSQNGRGKELEAYNLLKAYHLRAIDNDQTQFTITSEKKEIDRQWEASVLMETKKGENNNLLKYIINELYRIRQWSQLKRGNPFGKSKIKEFKGIQFNNSTSQLPLYNYSFLLYMYFNQAEEGKSLMKGVALRNGRNSNDQNPFVSINMDIINGKLFFEYIQTYVSAYNYIFNSEFEEKDILYQFKLDFEKYCCNYKGSFRKGDQYLKEVYITLIIALYDRFGENYVKKYYKNIYNLVYRKRLEHWSIFYAMVADFPIKYFKAITTAIDESGLEILITDSYQDIQCKKLGTFEQTVAEYIVNNTNTAIICTKDGFTIGNKTFKLNDKITKIDFNNGAQ